MKERPDDIRVSCIATGCAYAVRLAPKEVDVLHVIRRAHATAGLFLDGWLLGITAGHPVGICPFHTGGARCTLPDDQKTSEQAT